MIVRKLRLQKGWSQEQLAQLSGLSVRTVQRIERGQNAGLESLKSLAAVFELDLNTLQEKSNMPDNSVNQQSNLTIEEQEAIEYVRDIKGFYSHLFTYIVVIFGLFILNIMMTSNHLWVIWPALGWGIGIVSHGLSVFEVFNFFSPDWERKQIEKRLGRRF